MTLTRLTQISCALFLQLVASTAFSENQFASTPCDYLSDFQVSYGEASIDVELDGNGHYVGVSRNVGPRTNTDEYLGRSVWTAIVLDPASDDVEVLVVTMDPEKEETVLDFLIQNLSLIDGNYLQGAVDHALIPNALDLIGFNGGYEDEAYIEWATDYHVLVFDGPDAAGAEFMLDWPNGYSRVEAAYVADQATVSVHGSNPTALD